MASVAELIAAAEAQKSPFVSMLEGAAQGFGKAQNQDLDRAKGMMDLYKSQQDYQYKQMLNTANEQILKRHLNELSGDEGGPLPSQKFKTVFEINRYGTSFRKESIPEGSQKRFAYRTQVYLDPVTGRRRIGYFDPSTVGLIKSDDDAFAPEPDRRPPPRRAETPQEKVDRATIARLQQAQKESGAKGVPVSAELLKQGKEAADRLGLPTYEQTVEEGTPGVSGFLQRMVPGGKTGTKTRTEIGLGMAEGLSFNSVQDAEKANLPRGTRITIKGRPAVID